MNYHQISPPINSLPVELLAYIFVLGTHNPLPPDEDDDECQSFDSESVKIPLVYASVSRLWRNVALSTPALYTSLCITPNLLRADVLDVTPISTYLALSSHYLVDILIDARDHDWDFQDENYYAPIFSVEHMRAAMAVLLPHIRRWRSLSIFTDVYKPMHAALRPLEASLAAYGAPHLQTLRLMRCDSYAAHAFVSPVSNPAHVFLSSLRDAGAAASSLLPSLRHLSLRGIPAAWTPLASLLPTCLQSLDLAYHPIPTQPSIAELAALLAATPHLARLSVNGSGPILPFDPPTAPPAIYLPELRDVSLGYTSTASGLAFLRLLAAGAPSVRRLRLEDTSDPAALTPVDAGPLIAFLAPQSRGRNLNPDTPETRGAFPALTALELRRAHLVSPQQLEQQHPPLEVPHLTLVGMPHLPPLVHATHALCVRGGSLLSAPAVLLRAVLFGGGGDAHLNLSGSGNWKRELCELELHESVHPTRGGEVPVEDFIAGGTRVRVFRRSPDEDEESEDEDGDTLMGSDSDLGCAMDDEGMDAELEEAFKPGGVFNDPVFDARYSNLSYGYGYGYGYVGAAGIVGVGVWCL